MIADEKNRDYRCPPSCTLRECATVLAFTRTRVHLLGISPYFTCDAPLRNIFIQRGPANRCGMCLCVFVTLRLAVGERSDIINIMKLRQKLSLNLALTPQMKQSLHILQLPILELTGFIQSELEENPTLEKEDSKDEIQLDEKIEQMIDRQDEQINTPGSENIIKEMQKKRDYKETLITRDQTLGEHLLGQLRIQKMNNAQRKIGEFIIGSLDDNGYLNTSCEEIAGILNRNVSGKPGVEKSDVEAMLTVIQKFDPPGIAARNLKECLLIQLILKKRQKSLAYKIVKSHLPSLLNKKYRHIAKKLKSPLGEIEKAIGEIGRLEPKPGRAYEQSAAAEVIHIIPDVIVEKVNDRYEITVNTKWIPKLKVSAYHLKLLKNKKTPAHTRQYIRKKIQAALGLIQAITQREQTIRNITRQILKIQHEYFEHGDLTHLKPLALKDIAGKIQRNESTVSRVVSKKYIRTPHGIFRLDHFFSGRLTTQNGESVSQEHIKSKIASLLEEEDAKKPLPDGKIAKLLLADGIKIARRTVAKYREELKIPPYHQRKRR